MGLFYIRDARHYSGDCFYFWRAGGQGYTADLDAAWKLPEADARRMGERETDIPLQCELVDALASRHVDSERLVFTQPKGKPEIVGIDGTIRRAHYGAGEQPWDIMKRRGWAAHFAAANVLKYVRRYAAKNGNDDVVKARWYWAELGKMAQTTGDPYGAFDVRDALVAELSDAEWDLLDQV